ncbi:uncharacterized protein LOC108910916 isoform X2 [Anoplophora glabripennis]|nr:uncharacterized protein LOC108910916 isoform X2 [Anoplophora glabripennis]XP_018571190.1 uncharacterized protein LOC108910916 isoform X2 [Anoplophora glabripennis]XP_018571191.1 uncharacterized protein LOC108910916 isoform X2 [Anoplophora glabripennis]XP_018571192.1 uncharacterized protein LOC108910916 isoform X2 [Anoplophora glabripennis]
MVLRKINSSYTFQQFNSEINELYDYLRSEKYKDEEIKKIFAPLTAKVKKSNAFTYIFVSILVLLVSVYFLTYFDFIYWHVSAIARIALIKVLPYFDWRYLKNKQCLIEKLAPSTPSLLFNCDLCENIRNIHVYEDIDEDTLIQRYLELDVPLILTKGLEEWPKHSNFIDDVVKEDAFYYSYPCRLSTSIHRGSSMAGQLLEKVKSFDEFFLHFQNCDLEAMRVFRRFTYRPKFLPPTYSPVLYNWLVWNKDYNTTNYKPIDLVERVSIFSQLFGWSYVRLTPRLNCKDVCPELNIALSGGESLVFTNLWDLEYRPKEVGENMAVILETKD